MPTLEEIRERLKRGVDPDPQVVDATFDDKYDEVPVMVLLCDNCKHPRMDHRERQDGTRGTCLTCWNNRQTLLGDPCMLYVPAYVGMDVSRRR